MAHEVEASHEQNQVDEEDPVFLERDLALFKEYIADIIRPIRSSSKPLSFLECLGLRQHQASDDEDDRWAGGEPVKRAPAVRSCVDKGSSKCGSKEIPKGVLIMSISQ